MKLFVVFLFFQASFSLEWDFVEDKERIFTILSKNKFLIIIFTSPKYNLNSSKTIWYKLKKLKSESFIVQNKFYLLYINLNTRIHEWMKDFYELDEKINYFWLILNEKRYQFADFNDIINNEDLYDKCLSFLRLNVNKLSTEIENLDHFLSLYNSGKVIAIYFGTYENNDYKQFEDLISIQRLFNQGNQIYYYSFQKETRDLINKEVNFENRQDYKNKLVFFRHESLLNKFDVEKTISYSDFDSITFLRKISDIERYPKLRDCKNWKTIINPVRSMDYPLLVFLTGKKVMQKHLIEFEKAINNLPKLLIFTICDLNIEEWENYKYYFFEKSYINCIKEDSIYFIYNVIINKTKMNIIKMEGDFTTENIVKFVKKVYFNISHLRRGKENLDSKFSNSLLERYFN